MMELQHPAIAAKLDRERLLAQRAIRSRVDPTPHHVELGILGEGGIVLTPHTDGVLALPISVETVSTESTPCVDRVGGGTIGHLSFWHWECQYRYWTL